MGVGAWLELIGFEQFSWWYIEGGGLSVDGCDLRLTVGGCSLMCSVDGRLWGGADICLGRVAVSILQCGDHAVWEAAWHILS